MDELKPCPFCGCEPYVKPYNYGVTKKFYIVSCQHCGAEINNPVWTIDEAVQKWNTRFDQTER